MANPLGFTWEIGIYKNPDLVVPADGPIPAAPPPLACPGGTLVIYAADIVLTANCAPFAGFGNGNPWTNPVAINALGRAAAMAAKVACSDSCEKTVSLLWIGWRCGGNNPQRATAAAEIEVKCVLPDPSAITAFKEACRGLGEFPAPIFLGKGWKAPKKKKPRAVRRKKKR